MSPAVPPGRRRSIGESERHLFIPFAFKERADDGALIVFGKATDGTLDLDDQIVDPEWAKEALDEWFKIGNIRQMHSPHLAPAGKALELDHREDGHYLRARVIEPTAQKLVEEGVYTGFSVGIKSPRIIRDMTARNGRIVGGKIVEVSLVDYPANPSCLFQIAKRASDGQIEYVEKVVTIGTATETSEKAGAAEAAKCAACGCRCAPGQPDPDCACDCALCAAARAAGPAEKAGLSDGYLAVEQFLWKREFSQEHRERLAREGKALPDGSFPIETEEDLRNAIQAVGRAKDYDRARRHIIRRAKEMGKTDLLPADWPGSTKEEEDGEKGWTPEATKAALKRAHDLLCPAYDLVDVVFTYPELAKNGLATEIGPDLQRGVYQLLQHELVEDGGTGKECWDIEHLAKAYAMLASFLQAERLEMLSEQMFREVRADLHKDFREMFPDLRLTPGDPPPPTAFRRDYLGPGHQREVARAQDATPEQRPNPPAAEEFTRGYLTAGHQRPSPGNAKDAARPPAGQGGRVYYSNAAREQIRAQLQALHDSICALDHSVCPMHSLTTDEGALDTGARNVPRPVSLAAEPDLTKSLPVDALAAQLAEALATTVAEAAEKAVKGHLVQRIEELEQRVEEMSAEPDPRRAAYRGTALPREPVEAKRVSLANEASLAEKRRSLLEDHRLYSAMAQATTAQPGIREYAERQLARIEAELKALPESQLS